MNGFCTNISGRGFGGLRMTRRRAGVDHRRMQSWEYKVVPLDDARKVKKQSQGIVPEHLNELGLQGWEAVGVSLKQGDLSAWPVVLLKRQIP